MLSVFLFLANYVRCTFYRGAKVVFFFELCKFCTAKMTRMWVLSDFSCKRLRSGKRLDAASNAPDYNESSGFCFGRRRSLIQEYVEEAQYLEALTLMIDSLHSVNDPDVEREIPNCFRKAKEFKRAKRRLKKKLVNEASKGGVTCN